MQFAICAKYLVDNRRIGRDDIHIELTAEAFEDNFHVEEAKKSAAETESERDTGFGHVVKCRVIELKFPIADFRCSKSAVLIG